MSKLSSAEKQKARLQCNQAFDLRRGRDMNRPLQYAQIQFITNYFFQSQPVKQAIPVRRVFTRKVDSTSQR